ncbi:tripartite tricarboxylate transporter TctB family protein [Virgibacillus ndiopensis]|uniref:tripartite tricarboxylate transporter TctB family protein n=1 Tax=Virgibacillus ndiopensis TaxID=2004408 RepID=UPI000C0899E7|nr:tripartite tricarboxylate transporter TctB family protein [Virgibacillus ndiopensis]
MKVANIIFSVLLLTLMSWILYLTLQIPKSPNPNIIGPSYVPLVYVWVGIVLAVFILLNSIREKTKEQFKLDKKFFLYVGIAIVYMILITIIGYYISTILLLIILFLLLGIRKLPQLMIIPIAYSLFVFIVFEKIIALPIP